MARFLIGYDVGKQHGCVALHHQLEEWGAVKLLESIWLTSIEISPIEVRRVLQGHLGIDGRVAVIELTPTLRWSTGAGLPAGVNWLKHFIPGSGPKPSPGCRQGVDALRLLAIHSSQRRGTHHGTRPAHGQRPTATQTVPRVAAPVGTAAVADRKVTS
ncbi:MAG: hypothetical protein FJX35_05040 [Alphaproteobacteria bacterium]|nr:hypothetical protein [Alphaproteobacteria bacterium]